MRRSTCAATFRLIVAPLLFAAAVSAPRSAEAEVIRRLAGNGGGLSMNVVVSGNGRFVLRREPSGGSICGTPSVPTLSDLVVYDLETSRGECVSADQAGRGIPGSHGDGSISADGQLVVFFSAARGLDPRCDPPVGVGRTLRS